MFRGIGAFALAAVIAASFVAGCGGGGGSSSGGTTSSGSGNPSADISTVAGLTKADAIKEADTICKRGSDQIEAEFQPFLQKHGIAAKASLNPSQAEEFTKEVIGPGVQSQAEDLAKLGAPPGGQSELAAVVEGFEKVAKAAEEEPASLLKISGGPLEDVNVAAKAYGAKECISRNAK